MSHLEEDASTCLRKDEVYEDYRLYCEKHNQKTLNTADFGKVMKRAFPNVKPRRLGQRGQSRYCYGGMRKKLEVQPPSLPDLTAELSAPTLSTNFRSASSSVSSTDDHRSSLRGEASSWFSEEVRGVLGVTGPVLADVANVLLEYAQNVFGTTFTSLTKLAEHLVANRYVSTRSRHSFALIAHISNNPSNSTPVTGSSSLSNMLLSPSSAAAGAFAEALQKGVYGQAHRQSLDCYPNSSDASGIGLKLSNSAHSSPIISGKEDVKKEVVDQDLSCVELPSVRNTRTPTVRVSSAGATAAASSLSQTPPTTASQVAGGSLFPYRSPLCTNNYDNSRAERSPNVTASTPAVTSAYHISPSAHYPFTLSQFSTTSASILQNPAGKPLGSTYTGISAYLQPPQPYAHCSSTDHRRMSFSDGTPSYLAPVAGTGAYCASTPSTPYGNRGLDASAPYASYTGAFAPHSSSSSSALPHQQPPAPLPPTAGVRNPYTPIASYKRTPSLLPVDAPGANEPVTRVHLGGLSPTKQVNFFDLSHDIRSGTSGDYARVYQPQAPVAVAAGASPANRPGSGPQPQHSTGYYRGRYSNLGLLSPATSCQASPVPRLSTPPTSESSVTRPSQMKQSTLTRATDPYRGSAASPFDIHMNDGGDDGFDFDSLPRVGASPCPPAIPPSSPTEFLSFYSAETAARRKVKQRTSEDLDRTLTNLSSDGNGSGNGTSPQPTNGNQPLRILIGQDDEHETNLVIKREDMHDALLTPSGESESTTASPPVTPGRERFASSLGGSNGVKCPANTSVAPSQRPVASSSTKDEKPSSTDGTSVAAF